VLQAGVFAAVGEGVGGDVDDAHDPGAVELEDAAGAVELGGRVEHSASIPGAAGGGPVKRLGFGLALSRGRRCPCPPPERFQSSVRGTAFPATLPGTRSLRLLVAEHALLA